MKRAVFYFVLTLFPAIVMVGQQQINIHEYAKQYLLSNFRHHIIDSLIWGTSDTTGIDRRFSILLLDSATNGEKKLRVYNLMTNVSDGGVNVLVIVEKKNEEEKIKVMGAEYDYRQFVANLFELRYLAGEFFLKDEKLLQLYEYLMIQFDNREVRELMKPLFQDTL